MVKPVHYVVNILYLIASDVTRFEARSTGLDNDIRCTILYRSLQFLGFADDIHIISRTTANKPDKNSKQQELD